MKKQLHRLITIVLLAISILAITQMAVYAQDKTNVSLLKTSEESYIIYVQDTLNTEFLFSYSGNSETAVEDLTFSASGLDSNEMNVAYMTKEQADNFADGKVYIWVQVDEETEKYEFNLKQAVTSEEIELVNTTTKRIDVETDGNEKTIQNLEGVKITHTQGKVKITEPGEAFSYHMVKVSSKETTNFVELANKITESKELSINERIVLVREFTDTYNQILDGIEKWEEVPENKEILQPQESKEDDIYLVWLKNNETKEHDVQILLCDDNQDIEVEAEKKVTIYETVKLPITYDSVITLIVALIIIVAIIAILLIIKKKTKKNEA